MSTYEQFRPVGEGEEELEPGAIITAPAQFTDEEFIKLANSDRTLLNPENYPGLMELIPVNTFEQEINNPTPGNSDFFGYSVSINSEGSRVAIGAYQEDTGASNAGSVYIYEIANTTDLKIQAELNKHTLRVE